jgi:hypothetical protein
MGTMETECTRDISTRLFVGILRVYSQVLLPSLIHTV